MVFCRVDGRKFSGNSHGEYAVLKLGTSKPPGAIELKRYFDNEDKNNKNSHTGIFSPNSQDGNTLLQFWGFEPSQKYFIRPVDLTPDPNPYNIYPPPGGGNSFHIFGFKYGVFGTVYEVSNYYESKVGFLVIDDEDHKNANSDYEEKSGFFDKIGMVVGENTEMRITRVR